KPSSHAPSLLLEIIVIRTALVNLDPTSRSLRLNSQLAAHQIGRRYVLDRHSQRLEDDDVIVGLAARMDAVQNLAQLGSDLTGLDDVAGFLERGLARSDVNVTPRPRDGRVVQLAHGRPRRADTADERARREPFAVQHGGLGIRRRQHDVGAYNGLLSGRRERDAVLFREFRPALLAEDANLL